MNSPPEKLARRIGRIDALVFFIVWAGIGMHLKKYGKTFSTELLYETDDYEDFVVVCIQYSNSLNVALSEEFANLVPETGYNNGDGKPNIVLFWEYISDARRAEIIQKRSVSIRKNHWTRNEDEEFKNEIREKMSLKAIERWESMSIDERREMMARAHEGLRNFHADKESDKYKKWKETICEELKCYCSMHREVIPERNRRSRLNTSEESKQNRKRLIQEVYKTGKHQALFDRYSEERRGINNPAARLIMWYGEIYTKMEFEKKFGKVDSPANVEVFNVEPSCKKMYTEKTYNAIVCPHCNKSCSKKPSAFYRWHFDNCKEKEKKMKKLISIKQVEQFDIYDITVENDHCFELANGVVAHNSMFPKDIVGGGCVVAGTKIRMADGTVKNVEDFSVGDEIATSYGVNTVSHIWDPETLDEGNPECYEITFEDGYTVTCSDVHKFIIDGQWVEAKDIRVGMDVAVA